MAALQIASNNLVTCPFDPSHRVKESRYQLHLSKCKLNNLTKEKEPCPFNAQHLCDRGELQHHLMRCPDRGVLDKRLVASAEDSSYRGHTGVPTYNTEPIQPEESWDNEMAPCPTTVYKPSIEPPSEGMRTDFGFEKPAARKQYYQNLHHKNHGDEHSSSDSCEKEIDLPQLRNPTSKSYTQILDQQKPVQELKSIGLGRGHSAASANSKIAANIFGQQPLRQPNSAPKIPGFQPNSLGMGRGRSRSNDAKNQVESIDPVGFKGFGRGAKKA